MLMPQLPRQAHTNLTLCLPLYGAPFTAMRDPRLMVSNSVVCPKFHRKITCADLTGQIPPPPACQILDTPYTRAYGPRRK